MLEAKCSKCGESFNPADDDDLIHVQTAAEQECGGEGVITGTWGGVKFPDVEVRLVGTDGNVFSIIGLVSKALKRAGHADGAKAFTNAAFSAGSYDEVIGLAMSTVDVL